MHNTLAVITITKEDDYAFRRTLTSVCEQTNQAFDWVVVSSVAIAHDRINKFGLCSSGIADALNVGTALAATTAQWLIYLNGGDAFVSRKVIDNIYRSIASLPDAAAKVLYGNFVVIGPDGQERVIISDHNLLFKTNSINHQSVVIDSSTALKNPYDGRLLLGMDYDLWLRLEKSTVFHHLGYEVARFDTGGRSGDISWHLHQEFIRFVLRFLNARRKFSPRDARQLACKIAIAYTRMIVKSYIPRSITGVFRRI